MSEFEEKRKLTVHTHVNTSCEEALNDIENQIYAMYFHTKKEHQDFVGGEIGTESFDIEIKATRI